MELKRVYYYTFLVNLIAIFIIMQVHLCSLQCFPVLRAAPALPCGMIPLDVHVS